MKLALFATLLTFSGSLAGFGLSAGTAGAPGGPVAVGAAAQAEDVVARGRDRDCPAAAVRRA